ncbi:MAG: rod shape-determining protein RodA [Paludibacteraceae bacterium]|nr:rod shape-determining protein RodA [Paludibacteraceae bacterium]
MNQRNNIWSGVDWITIVLFLALAFFGWLNIYGAGYSFEQTGIFSFDNRAGKQFVWIMTALVMGLCILLIDEKTYDILGYWFYGFTLLLLIATPFLAHDIKGSLSWITLGPVSLQPAEFAKCFTAIAIAKYMGRYGYRVDSWRDLVVPCLMVLLPMAIIMIMQRETGSALVFGAFLLPFYRQGMTGKIMGSGVLVAIIFVVVMKCGWIPDSVLDKVFEPHQKTRIEVLLGIKEDPMGAGYNVNQSLIAIGSGGMFGKGYLKGTQTKMKFVPEQDTDFIFCTVGEEWGFVGSALLLLAYMFFILRLIMIAERQRDTFSRIYCYSVASIFLMHLIINIGMVLGLLPVIGIPLPLFSYGGSSLWGFTLLLFILLRLDASRVNKLH